jgi:enoyl-CoA hydratase/carnithine racemase
MTTVETTTEQLLAEREGHVLVLTMNRPDRLNAISGPMLQELVDQLNAANRDPEVRCIILTGAGRGFCSGLDLVDQAAARRDASEDARPMPQLFDTRGTPPSTLFHMDKPVIAAVNGAAAGYGMDLALLCDIRIAGESAKFAPVMVKRNVLPESGGSWLLPRLVGWGKAAEIFYLGRNLDARQSLDYGLVNKVVPDDELMTEAMAWAQEIAANAPMAVQTTKRMMRQGLDEGFDTTVDHVAVHLGRLFAADDFKEGVASFIERRDPEFKGR